MKQVEYPDDDALVFDVETLVLHQNCPVIAIAASSTAWYFFYELILIKTQIINSNVLKGIPGVAIV